MALLEVRSIGKSFRGLRAVNGVTFAVAAGAVVGMIGPNGAGKTTCFNIIAGVLRPDIGAVLLEGRDITRLRPDQICRAGIGRTFQLVKPFPHMTVRDNVVVGALHLAADVAAARQEADRILALLHLDHKAAHRAGSLTLAERKRLEVARAMGTRPKVLLLDEVMAGLIPGEVDEMVEVFTGLNRTTGLTILLIEHVMRAVMALAQTVVVLHHGECITAGPPAEVVRHPDVLECYFGVDML